MSTVVIPERLAVYVRCVSTSCQGAGVTRRVHAAERHLCWACGLELYVVRRGAEGWR